MSKPLKGYENAINWLFEQFPSYQIIGSKAYKPTLENISILLDILDNPQEGLSFVHVAGSNGKGSTCSIIASILTESNYKVGLFTSPHIKDFTERIRVNGECINQNSVVDFVETIRNYKLGFSPSFFEISFAMAIDFFAKKKCDICVIETGLGGRLDATNIVTPILSIITTISLEHTELLGDTLEEIAVEKAGIIKVGIPVVIGDMSDPIRQLLLDRARKQQSNLVEVDSTLTIPNNFPLLGNYQHSNFRLAITSLKELETMGYSVNLESISLGLKNILSNTGFKARLQILYTSPLTLIDVSHNPDGIRATLETVEALNKGKIHIIFGSSEDKDLNGIMSEFPLNSRIFCTTFSNKRSATIDQMRKSALTSNPPLDYFDDPKIALKSVRESALTNDTILIIGSFFLVSEYF